MAEWRKIQTRFWDDPETLDSTPEDRLFWIYLLSNPLTKACGVYTLHPKQASMHTGYNLETITSLLARFVSYGRILYNEETREVFIRKWFVYNSPNSPKILALIEKELESVKTAEFKNAVLQAIGYSIDTVSRKTAVDVDVDIDREVEEPIVGKSRQAIDHLNEEAGTRYKHSESSLRHIRARIQDGATMQDIRAVIEHKVAQWKDDAKMREYLRPSTLFRPSHFEEYVDAARRWVEGGRVLAGETKNAASMLQQHDPSIYDRGRMGG